MILTADKFNIRDNISLPRYTSWAGVLLTVFLQLNLYVAAPQGVALFNPAYAVTCQRPPQRPARRKAAKS